MVNKKAKKAEKSKVKLKKNTKGKEKFLPKGGNVTNTNFKVKPIIIQEQLRLKDGTEVSTRKKLTFQELLLRINHHNDKMRVEACNGLMELLGNSLQKDIELQLYSLVQVAKLFLDDERKVRHQAIKFITELLAKVSDTKVEPFFEVLISYAACALTHLNSNIQEDSLLIIDAFLDQIPTIITKHYIRLFPNFVSLISKFRNGSTSAGLNVKLCSSLTTVRWNAQVLHRLQGILKAIVKEKQTTVNPISTIVANSDCKYIPLHVGLPKTNHYFLQINERIDNDDFSKYINIILPLLYESFIESFQGHNKLISGPALIDYDSAVILNSSLETFHLLWEYACKIDKQQKGCFITRKNQRFPVVVLHNFPYQLIPGSTSKVSLDVQINPKMVKENLSICLMFCSLLKNFSNVDTYSSNMHVVQKYLLKSLRDFKFSKSGDLANLLLSILRMIVFEMFYHWSLYNFDYEGLLASLIYWSRSTLVIDEVQVELFKFLCDIVKVPQLNSVKSYTQWLSSVPELLCKPKISLGILNCISLLSRQHCEDFSKAITVNFETIIDNIETIEVVGNDWYQPTLKILHILFTLDAFHPYHIQYMKRFAETCSDADLRTSIINLMNETIY